MDSSAQHRLQEQAAGAAALRERLVLAGLTALAMTLRFWRLGEPVALSDESYYWLWSRHLALCYLDNPAGVAWQTWLGTFVGGQTEFGLRWLNALLGVLSVVLMYGLGRRLFGAGAGLLAAAFLAVGAPYVLVSRFVYTDALPVFLLLVNLNLLAPFLRAGRPVPGSRLRWLAIGLTWMLLLNTKISLYPYALALALGILAWQRHLLRLRRFWVAVAMGAVGTLPWLVWNATHAWVGLRWMWLHTTQGTVRASPLAATYHMVTYLSPGLLLFVLLGFLLWHRREGQWLILAGLLQLLPVALSSANSPRNLLVGSLPLIAAAGGWANSGRGASLSRRVDTPFALYSCRWQLRPGGEDPRSGRPREGIEYNEYRPAGARRPTGEYLGRRWRAVVALWLVTALVGVGTAVALVQEPVLPHSSIVSVLRHEGVGIRELGELLRTSVSGPGASRADELILTVDYNLAAQLWYYSGRPVYTSWPQYQFWGIPEASSALVLSLGYVPNELVSASMARSFGQWEGPSALEWSDGATTKRVYVWRGDGLRVPASVLVQALDFFALEALTKAQVP